MNNGVKTSDKISYYKKYIRACEVHPYSSPKDRATNTSIQIFFCIVEKLFCNLSILCPRLGAV